MPTLTPGDGQDLLARFKQARERRDVDRMVALFREDAEFRPEPFEAPLVGEVAIREHWNQAAATLGHVEFDAERIWVTGSSVLASWHGAVTRRATAERIRERGFLAVDLDDAGSVTRWRQWTVSRSVGTDAGLRAEPATEEEGPDGS